MNQKVSARDRILMAAKELFYEKGYEKVSVREIAKKADCSHTSLYVYFKDKLDLLENLAVEPLHALNQKFVDRIAEDMPLNEKVETISMDYISFGLQNRDLYALFMTYKANRMDEPTDWVVGNMRIKSFNLFHSILSDYCKELGKECPFDLSKSIFYTLHGIIMTYIDTKEEFHIVETRIAQMLHVYYVFLFT